MKGKTKGKDDFMQKKRILCKKMNKNSGILNIPEEFAIFLRNISISRKQLSLSGEHPAISWKN